MNFFDRMVSLISPRAALRRVQWRAMSNILSRKYEGAGSGRRTKHWHTNSSSAAAEVETSIIRLRDRARSLVRDNPYAAKGLQAITANVIGWGINGQVKVEAGQKNSSGVNKASATRSKELSNVWKSWANSKAVDWEGRNNFYGLQRLAFRTLVESGEVLIRKRRVGRRTIIGEDGFPVEIPPLSLQVLEGDYLPIWKNWEVPNGPDGNHIVDGIEFDKDGKRVAYHMYENHPGNAFSMLGLSMKTGYKTVRIPAEDIIHIYRLDRPGQIRGASWFAPVMMRIKDFDEYEDAQLVRQKIAAMFAVFVKDLDGAESGPGNSEAELGEKVEPGIIEILPPGKDITLAQPPMVQNYGEYASCVLHAIAAGLGITYEELTGDLSQVNFSSARMGYLAMSRNIEEWREDIAINQMLNPVFDWWRDSAELIGLDTTRARPVWTAPRREMVDPAKEVAATKDAIRAGLMTQSEAVRQQGYDPERFFQEMAEDNKVLDTLKLILDSDARNDPKRLAALAGGQGGGGDNSPEPPPEKPSKKKGD